MKTCVQSTKAKKGRQVARPDKPTRPLSAYNLYYTYRRQKMIEAFANVAIPVTQDEVIAISITPVGLENEKVDDTKTMSPDKLNALRRENIRQELEPQIQALSLSTSHTAYKQGSLRGVISFVDLAKLMVASWKNCDEFSKNVFEQLAKEGREIRAEQKRKYLEELPAEPTKEPQAQVKGNEPSNYMKWFRDTKKLYPLEPNKKRQRSKSAKKAQTTKEDNTSASRKISPSQTYVSSTQKSKISVKEAQTTNEKHIKSASKQISPSPTCSSNKSNKSVASSSKDDLTFVEVEGIDVEVADSMVRLSKKNQTQESAPKHYCSRVNQMCALSADTLELLARKNVPARNPASPPQADLVDFLAKKKNAPASISLPVHEAEFVHTTVKRGLIRPMNECFVSTRPNKMCALDLLGKMNMTAKNPAPIQEDHVGYLGKEKLPPYTSAAGQGAIEYLAKKNLPANVVASVQGAPTNNSGFVYVDRGLVSHNGDDFTRLVSDGSGKSSAFSSPQPIKPAVNVTTVHSTNAMLKSRIRELEGALANERLSARVRELEVELSRTRAVGNLNSYPTAAAAARYHPEIPHGLAMQNVGTVPAGFKVAMMPLSTSLYPADECGMESSDSSKKRGRGYIDLPP